MPGPPPASIRKPPAPAGSDRPRPAGRRGGASSIATPRPEAHPAHPSAEAGSRPPPSASTKPGPYLGSRKRLARSPDVTASKFSRGSQRGAGPGWREGRGGRLLKGPRRPRTRCTRGHPALIRFMVLVFAAAGVFLAGLCVAGEVGPVFVCASELRLPGVRAADAAATWCVCHPTPGGPASLGGCGWLALAAPSAVSLPSARAGSCKPASGGRARPASLPSKGALHHPRGEHRAPCPWPPEEGTALLWVGGPPADARTWVGALPAPPDPPSHPQGLHPPRGCLSAAAACTARGPPPRERSWTEDPPKPPASRRAAPCTHFLPQSVNNHLAPLRRLRRKARMRPFGRGGASP